MIGGELRLRVPRGARARQPRGYEAGEGAWLDWEDGGRGEPGGEEAGDGVAGGRWGRGGLEGGTAIRERRRQAASAIAAQHRVKLLRCKQGN